MIIQIQISPGALIRLSKQTFHSFSSYIYIFHIIVFKTDIWYKNNQKVPFFLSKLRNNFCPIPILPLQTQTWSLSALQVMTCSPLLLFNLILFFLRIENKLGQNWHISASSYLYSSYSPWWESSMLVLLLLIWILTLYMQGSPWEDMLIATSPK